MWRTRCGPLIYMLAVWASLLPWASQNTRDKRQIFTDQPRLITQNGHLIIQSGTNHNITFRSGYRSGIYMNNVELNSMASQVNINRMNISTLTTTNRQQTFRLSSLNYLITSRTSALNSTLRLVQNSINAVRTLSQSEGEARRQINSQIEGINQRLSTIESTLQTLQQQLTVNDCSSGTECLNGGTCIDLYQDYYCICPSNWQGRRCETDVNECQLFIGTVDGCQNGATCINSPGSYTCQCAHDWYGVHCTEEHDDCHGSNSQMCGQGRCINHQRTQPGQPSYSCECFPGYTLSTTSGLPVCVDVDECSLTSGHRYPCSTVPHVNCINVPGSFYCGHCPQGYDGNGTYCSLSDRCLFNNGGCHPSALCHAPSGYAITCMCRDGYVGNGFGLNGCIPQSSSAACVSSPCLNGGTCIPHGINLYVCSCPVGFGGPTCTSIVTACASSPCLNNGICIAQNSNYICNCTTAYTGYNCERQQQECGLLEGEMGTLKYPREESTYNHDVFCTHHITTTQGKIVNLNFTDFHLESSFSRVCYYDFLEIFDGPSPQSHSLGKYCGTSLQRRTLRSTQNQMTLQFKSDFSIAHSGFQLFWSSNVPACGGLLSGQSQGTISSPQYPLHFPPGANCVWVITVTTGRTVAFTLGQIDLNCSNAYIDIRDGENEGAPLLQKICGSNTPSRVVSTGPSTFIRFYSNYAAPHQGFSLTYRETGQFCGHAFTGMSGTFNSPSVSADGPRHCVWTITVPENKFIELKFSSFRQPCQNSMLTVHDGNSFAAPILSRLCGDTAPSGLNSTGNTMHIEWRSDSTAAEDIFIAQWNGVCGRKYVGETGVMGISTTFTDTCVYSIEAPLGMSIFVAVTNITSELGENCEFQLLSVYDGNSSSNNIIRQVQCLETFPQYFRSSSNQMLMVINYVDEANEGYRLQFTANYSAQSDTAVCGGVLNEPHGSLRSPRFPNVYDHGLNCTWYITVDEGHIIKLIFHIFELEGYRCQYDFVDVYDGATISGQRMGRYCGSTKPPELTSTGNAMVVSMVTDSIIQHIGFYASYVSFNQSLVCGRTLTSSSGIITSPSYPNDYPGNKLCEWTIIVGDGKKILLNISDFEMEPVYNCHSDYLEIRNGGFRTSPLLTKLCGYHSHIEPIKSHSNRLYLRFKTGYYGSAKGFYLEYSEDASGCGGDLTAHTGSIESPNYPDPYPPNTLCQWKIHVAAGSKIIMTFDDHFHISCFYDDYIEIIEGKSHSRILCGLQAPRPITFLSSELVIVFKSDGYMSGIGFSANYYSECNNVFNGTEGVIESPNFPSAYPPSQQCSWSIQVPQGNKINAHFAFFNLEPDSSCRHDYVQITGSNLTESKLCGDIVPPSFMSRLNQLNIGFQSDVSNQYTGFRLEWILSGCGKSFSVNSGSFTSPGYPQHYSTDLICIWEIMVDEGYVVKLFIEDLDLEYHGSCASDALEVYSRNFDEEPFVKLCHTQNNTQYVTSENNHMLVKFRSNMHVVGRGLKANFTAVQRGCGSEFSTYSGTFKSKNYPNSYGYGFYECGWHITVQEGYIVKLTFSAMDLECHSDELQIYNGENEDGTLLGTLCQLANSTASYSSETNKMFIKMIIRGWSNSHSGFLARYTTVCGGRRNAEASGEVFSPPGQHSRSCTWLITSSTGHIYLTFLEMNIPGECYHSSVVVITGEKNSTFCRDILPHPVYTQGSTLQVIFSFSDSLWTDYQGEFFRARYSSLLTSCGGTLQSIRGRFASPRYPLEYPDDTECVWQISITPGNRLEINFLEFQLIGGHNNDYVEIRTPDVNGRILGRWFGDNLPSNITQLPGAWILFRSDEQGHSRGFVADYTQSCGGELRGANGQIASLNKLSKYLPYLNCLWNIQVQGNMKIKITFNSFEMEGLGCYYDYIQIFDGDESGTEIGRYCGLQAPGDIFSSSNEVTVKFVSDDFLELSGFLLTWEEVMNIPSSPVPGCGGNLTAGSAESVLTSPGHPSNYINDLICFWTITAPIGKTILVTLHRISIEGLPFHCFDYLRFYDGISTSSASITDRICHLNLNTVKSRRNILGILFNTDYGGTDTGFSLTYKEDCGGMIEEVSTGIIQSVNYSVNYPENQNCEWKITVRRGKTIRLQFAEPFDIVNNITTFCQHDYLKLYNGPSLSSPPLLVNGSLNVEGIYCGQTAPQGLETSSNELFVQFVSDGSNSGAGFSFTFTEVSLACGGTLTLSTSSSTGNFSSPNHPGDYPHNVDCSWRIIAPPAKRIRIDFLETFFIQPNPRCQYDYVQFHDGGTAIAPVIGENFCGTHLPSTIYSSSNVLLVRFRTDDSIAHSGFKARYSIATCGGRVRSGNGTITSPNFPSNYNPNVECEWEVIGTVGHYLTFTFVIKNLAFTQPCVDFIEIIDGNATDPVIFNSCSDHRMSVDTSDSRAYVKFKSGGTISRQGFKLNFQSSLEECGGHWHGSSGIIKSPNFPNPYAHNRVCVWKIEVAGDRSIALTFSNFALQHVLSCTSDYVEVFNGIEPDSPSLGKFCGEVIPPVLQSTGNTMKITFKTDSTATHSGFRATYSSDDDIVCGRILTDLTGVVTSPQDNNTLHNVQCIWRIESGEFLESSVRLHFINFHLEAHGDCSNDVLEIREGVDRTGQLVGRFCGNTVPDDIVIPGKNVWIMYKTNSNIPSVGFNITFAVLDCGGYRDSEGNIIAPVLGDGSYTSKACAWEIQAPEGSRIKILPLTFNLSCADGYLSIQNGGFPDSPLIGNYCNSSLLPVFTSQSSELRIKSVLNGSLAGQTVFNLQYTFESGGCGGLYHGINGTIMSPNHPRSYPHDTECKWEIHVEQGYYVNLQFNVSFDMAANDSCEHDFVQVIDVIQDGTEVILGKWCSNQVPPVQKSSLNKMIVIFRSDHTTNGLGFSAVWTRVCGGVYSSEAGNIYSPGYPRNYTNNLRCFYKISPGANKLIILRFIDLQLDLGAFSFYRSIYFWPFFHYFNPNVCWGDKIVVKKKAFYHWTSEKAVCRTNNLQNFHSQSWMELTFYSDSSRTERGFHAQYESMDCGGNLTNSSGIISSHPFLQNFTGTSTCLWYITTEPSKVINLKFTALDLSTDPSCSEVYFEVYDGHNISSPAMGHFCSLSNAKGVLQSSTNNLTLKFNANFVQLNSRRTFQAEYWSSYGPSVGCGGRLNQSQGSLTSVDVDNNGFYEPGLECLWYIIVGPDKIITINITQINIDGQSPCENDYLVVYDGLQEHEFGRYCGNLSDITLQSSGNEVTVAFVSDSVSSSSGFRITYAERDRLCGGFYNATLEDQTISSPNYPNTYGQPIRCTWIIDSGTSSNENKVNITDRMCSNGASVIVSDKPLNAYGQLINLCDPGIHDPFYSIYQQARITYNGNSNSKFQLKYSVAGCNRNYSQPSGRIFSSGFPFTYRHRETCTYGISMAENTSIAIYFRRFHLEYHYNCGYDYLQIQNSSSSSLGKFCGAIVPSPVFITDNVATLVFRTDQSIHRDGFDIIYISSTQGPGCGGNLTGLNFGIFTSPGYPGNSSVAQTCSWLISPHSTLLFQYVQMSPSSNCNTDYVAVYQGSTVEDSLISHYCNEVETISPRLFSSTILVRYVSSGNATAPVFKFSYAPTPGEL